MESLEIAQNAKVNHNKLNRHLSPEVRQEKKISGAISPIGRLSGRTDVPNQKPLPDRFNARKPRKPTRREQIKELKKKCVAQKILTHMLVEDFKNPAEEIISLVKRTRKELLEAKVQLSDARLIQAQLRAKLEVQKDNLIFDEPLAAIDEANHEGLFGAQRQVLQQPLPW
jgi:hypothetical protein